MKYMIAAAKVFQIRGLQALATDEQKLQGNIPEEQIHVPPPIFISKKPKYPTAFRPFTNFNTVSPNMGKNFIPNEQFLQRKMKRKYIRSEAERACAKEAAASRLALEALQKELATAPQVNSFVIEESCTETTVENFIPHTDETFIDNLNDIQGVQVVNYADLSNPVYSSGPHIVNLDKQFAANPLIQYNIHNTNQLEPDVTTDKIKNILGNGLPSNVEIMFKTSDGNYISVPDEVLQNITKGNFQYQVIDENGQESEIQELRVLDKAILDPQNESTVEGFVTESENTSASQSFANYTGEDSKIMLTDLSGTTRASSLDATYTTALANESITKDFDKFSQSATSMNFENSDGEPELLNLSTKKHSDDPNNSIENILAPNLSTSMDETCNEELYNAESKTTFHVTDVTTTNEMKIDSNAFNSNQLSNVLPHYDSQAMPVLDTPNESFKFESSEDENSMQQKKMKRSVDHIEIFEENLVDLDDSMQCMLNSGGGDFSPRKTRSNFKVDSDLIIVDESGDSKRDKNKRLLSGRKRK